jgi:hypothetical protein
MFLIASSGRSGTLAVCNGLNKFSDHTVMHEPEPTLLEEAFRKHKGLPFDSPVFQARMAFFRDRNREQYGESFRAPNLLPEILRVAPDTKFLILVRPPAEYVVSAHAKFVFRKPDDSWDRFRIIPEFPGKTFDDLPLSDKIAWHWAAVNRYLLDFAEEQGPAVRVAVITDLQDQIRGFAGHLGVAIRDPEGLAAFLASRPNASDHSEFPAGYNAEKILSICGGEWRRAERLAARP